MMITPRSVVLGNEDKKQILGPLLVTPEGRVKILTSLLGPLRNIVEYVTRPQAAPYERSRLISKVALAEAVLSRCTGEEEFDMVALSGILSDAKSIVAGCSKDWKGDHREERLAEWVRTVGGLQPASSGETCDGGV